MVTARFSKEGTLGESLLAGLPDFTVIPGVEYGQGAC